MKIRLKFSKTGYGKYISHLDLIRCFSRTLCRAELPVKYSEGFNPHQQMSFLLPLPVGVSSECELLDIEFAQPIGFDEVKNKLNNNLPPDIRISEVFFPDFKARDMTIVEYDMGFWMNDLNNAVDINLIKEFLSREEVSIIKKTKRGEKTVNMMDYIHSFQIAEEANNGFKLKFQLKITEGSSLKPNLIAGEIEKLYDPMEFDRIDIMRTKILN